MDENLLEIFSREAKGCYVLIIRSPENGTITVGSLGERQFQAGYFTYVGSALGGLKARLARHLRQEKKLHWHIDYLVQQAVIEDIIVVETAEPVECAIARTLSDSFPVIPNFGSSDCRCPGHLFFSERLPVGAIMQLLREAGFAPVSVKD